MELNFLVVSAGTCSSLGSPQLSFDIKIELRRAEAPILATRTTTREHHIDQVVALLCWEVQAPQSDRPPGRACPCARWLCGRRLGYQRRGTEVPLLAAQGFSDSGDNYECILRCQAQQLLLLILIAMHKRQFRQQRKPT